MSSDSEWMEEEREIDYRELLEVPRGSGDGESKETSPHTSASEDDNQETKQTLIDAARKVERRKDKKVSKIPVWQSKGSHHADVAKSTYDNGCHSQQLDLLPERAETAEETFRESCDKRETVFARDRVSPLHIKDAIPTSDSLGSNEPDTSSGGIKLGEDNATNLDNTNVFEIEREKLECGRAEISGALELEEPRAEYGPGILRDNENVTEGDDARKKGAKEDIVSGADSGSNNCCVPEDLCGHILEAPEEFRSLRGERCLRTLPMDAQDEEETALRHPASSCTDVDAPARDHDKTTTPEASNVCGRASNKDAAKNARRGIETAIAPNFVQEPRSPLEICMTNEGKHRVTQSEVVSDRRANTKSPAAPCGTMAVTCNSNEELAGGGGDVSKDNDQMRGDLKTQVVVVGRVACGLKGGKEERLGKGDGNSDKVDGGRDESSIGGAVDVTLSAGVTEQCADNRGAEERGAASGFDPSSALNVVGGAYACAGNEQIVAAAKASIAIGVAGCAQAPRCSRISAATVCAASTADSSKSTTFQQNPSPVRQNVIERGGCDTSLISDTCNNRGNAEARSDSTIDGGAGEKSPPAAADTHLVFGFKNGRLVFDTPIGGESEQDSRLTGRATQCQSKGEKGPSQLGNTEKCDETIKDVLCSRDLNRRAVEGRSRLKHLENKLKEAGITDGKGNVPSDANQPERDPCKYNPHTVTKQQHVNDCAASSEGPEDKEETKQVVDKLTLTINSENLGFDDNQNVVCSGPGSHNLKEGNSDSEGSDNSEGGREDEGGEDEDRVNFDVFSGSLCEFDVRRVGSFADYGDSDFYVVYDELEDCSSGEEDECEQHEQEEHYRILISEMRGDGGMGTDGERGKQHNPDRENLKSLLKKPGRGKEAKKNRVVFNEKKNEFFDADYIILIREECDYDDEEDDGVCTCNDHEMVRLTCCEPNCNCNIYEGYDQTPQSPKFAPPLEFVDAVTLSPPEGYKDMELGEQQLLALQQMARRGQRPAVCRDCSATHDDGEGSLSDNEDNGETQSDHEDAREEAEKTDQSQQTTPTTPPSSDAEGSNQHQYILETVTMTTVTERRIMREMEEEKRPGSPNLPPGGSPISGILKGGRLWKQHSQEVNNAKNIELQPATDSSVTSDEESNGNSKRSVRFIESGENKRDCCDGAADNPEEEITKQEEQKQTNTTCNSSVSPESTEMMLTFKLGNHILISNNSLKPNSAVRQLFPCSKPLSNKPGESDSVHQYLVTAESLRAFEEAKRSKLPQIIQSDETDESIKRAIERNTLRRSLIRYEPRPKKKEQKTDNSLVERIKQLTCDVDDDVVQETEEIPQRSSPPGEEARKSPEVNPLTNKIVDKSFSPSSSSTASSNSSSVSSTYKKITDLFGKREKPPDIQNNTIVENSAKVLNQLGPAPDLGNTGPHQQEYIAPHCPVAKVNSTSEARKQFLSSLAPLTACVSGTGADDHYYHVSHQTGDRSSVTSSIGTEYSLEDIDEGLKNEEEDAKRNAPDVVVGTPSASESGDELAMFVQQDASRIERIKKKYQPENVEDDEHDDYGFNKRPSVRGIKPRFGTTTEILQQIQSQMQPPQAGPKSSAHAAWPYYSEASFSGLDNNKSRNINQNVPQYQYAYVTEEMKAKMYVQHYRPTTLVEDNIYQNCTNQRCNRDVTYKTNVNHIHSPVMRIGGGCSEIYHQAVPLRNRNGRPESPPPFDVARNVHQTMVYIPYNHIESYQAGCVSPNPQYATSEKCYARVVNQNQINNRYVEPLYHNQPTRMSHPPAGEEAHYQVNIIKQVPKPMMRLPYPLPNAQAQPHLVSSRSDSPLPGQFSTARSTQTSVPALSTCNYYPTITPRYRPAIGPVIAHAGVVWNGENMYATKVNRHSFPITGPRYPNADNISLTDSESQYSGPVPNGFRQTIETTFSAQKESAPNSPTKPRFIERGVPEGAASVSPQDNAGVGQSTSTMTSPTSPQNPQQGNPKPLFYAMNV